LELFLINLMSQSEKYEGVVKVFWGLSRLQAVETYWASAQEIPNLTESSHWCPMTVLFCQHFLWKENTQINGAVSSWKPLELYGAQTNLYFCYLMVTNGMNCMYVFPKRTFWTMMERKSFTGLFGGTFIGQRSRHVIMKEIIPVDWHNLQCWGRHCGWSVRALANWRRRFQVQNITFA